MADKKISALTAASTPLAGTEVLPIVQGGTTVQVSVANLTAGRAVASTSLATNVVYTSTLAASPATTGQNFYVYSGGGLNVSAGLEWQYSASGSGYGFKVNVNGGTDAIEFGYRANSATWTRAFAVGNNGNATIDTGNLVIGTAGKGIDFSANGGDVLSQYDEGTYTPVFTASSSNPTVTYGLQRGKYVRVGNSVTVSVFITWSAFSGGSGDLQISLPFAGESSVGAGGAGSISDLTGFTFAAGRTFCSIRPNSNVLYATFPQSGSLVSTSNTTVAQTAASGLIVFSTTYLI